MSASASSAAAAAPAAPPAAAAAAAAAPAASASKVRHAKKRKRKDALKGESPVPEYTCLDGVRYVKPYPYRYVTHAKGRWLGRTLSEVFTNEFRAEPPAYYAAAIGSGRIRVDDAVVTGDHVLRNGEVISHLVHRHEPPVLCPPRIAVLKETPSLLCVLKPATVPMHPCGAYHQNSVTSILRDAARQDAGGAPPATTLHLVHRLDRLTSGVSLLAKDSASATRAMKHIQNHEARKVYLARVAGKFPTSADAAAPPDAHVHVAPGPASEPAGTLTVTSHIRCADARTGVYENCAPTDGPAGATVRAAGPKAAETVVRRLAYSAAADESLVECRPVTGRTHQIRLHVRGLGHPIANDPCYGPPGAPGRADHPVGGDDDAYAPAGTGDEYTDPQYAQKPRDGEAEAAFLERTCRHCRATQPVERPRHDGIFLYAYRYTLPDIDKDDGSEVVFEAPPPAWAPELEGGEAGEGTGEAGA